MLEDKLENCLDQERQRKSLLPSGQTTMLFKGANQSAKAKCYA
jgi:hypothetical protein